MPSDLSRYQYDPSLLSEFIEAGKPALIDFVERGEKWGGTPQRSIEDIMQRISSGEMKTYGLPKDLYSEVRGPTELSSGGFHGTRDGQEGIFLKGQRSGGGFGHEIGHEFYGHRPSGTVPEMNWYNKLDRKLKGWLPSLSKYAERPKFTSIENTPRRWMGYSGFEDREEYNKRMLTGEYNPKFGDAPFDYLKNAMWNLQDQSTRDAMMSNVLETVETKGGDYGKYDKRSLKAKDFRYAFKEARQEGLKEFDWDGMKYTTELG
jgi:hypothetical protein